MNITKQAKNDFKAIKNIFDTASKHAENEKHDLAEYYENKAVKNVEILVNTLKLPYDIIIDLIFDFEYTVKNFGFTYQV